MVQYYCVAVHMMQSLALNNCAVRGSSHEDHQQQRLSPLHTLCPCLQKGNAVEQALEVAQSGIAWPCWWLTPAAACGQTLSVQLLC